jgi:hypothetical protein
MCFKWPAAYYSISKIFHDLHNVNYRELGNWKDENKTLLYCDLPEGPFRKADVFVFGLPGKPSLGTYEWRHMSHSQGRNFESGFLFLCQRNSIYVTADLCRQSVINVVTV